MRFPTVRKWGLIAASCLLMMTVVAGSAVWWAAAHFPEINITVGPGRKLTLSVPLANVQPHEELKLPSGRYMHDDVQYFPPGPAFPWANSQQAAAQAKGAVDSDTTRDLAVRRVSTAPGTPSPPPLPVLPDSVPPAR